MSIWDSIKEYGGAAAGAYFGGAAGLVGGALMQNGGTGGIGGVLGMGTVETPGAGGYMPGADSYHWGAPDDQFYDQWQSRYRDRETGAQMAGFDVMHRDAPELSFDQSNQARAMQMGAAQNYQAVLTGKTPSVAQMQMKQGVNDANAMAMQNAASARGGNAALAQRAAANQSIMASQRSVQDTAMLRAKEQEAARQGLAGVGAQMRQGDLSQQGLVSQNELGGRASNVQAANTYFGQANAYMGAQQHAADQYSQGRLTQAEQAQNAQKMAQENRIKAEMGGQENKQNMWSSVIGAAAKGGAGG